VWLLKPTGLNRGRGIHIFDSVQNLETLIADYKKVAKPKARFPKSRNVKFIIQKYIENPMLINSRKFDIRVWVLLTHRLEVYYFSEGYLRTSAEPYDLQELDNY
jgi:hypothetical protein